jgi:starch phosphorylase
MMNRGTYHKGSKIAYFSMEIGLKNDIPTYSGGLGILAGDLIKSSADLDLPLIAITLVNSKGYLHQELTTTGTQIESPEQWNPSAFMVKLPHEVTVHIEGRVVTVNAWCYEWKSPTGGVIPIFFLDTNVVGNHAEDREITAYLYGGDKKYRLKQEIVLGIGGVKLIEALQFKIRRYHMNEGHSSLLGLELLQMYGMDEAKVREKCIFTTHSPVAVGYDQFPYDLVQEVLGEPVPLAYLKKIGGHDCLNLTILALNLSKYHNGVAQKHREISEQLFPGYEINAITNGIHSYTWTHPNFQKLFDNYFPRWANEPELLVRVETIPDVEIWQAHMGAKKELIDYVNTVTNVGMEYDVLTVGFARRATGYKRATLLFSDLERLRRIGKADKIQFILAGKAHPQDVLGKKIIEEIFGYIKELEDVIKIVYLQDYEFGLAQKMISGVDVWLNTPLRPFEASGTSGMKAAHNGVINFSVLDGWWIEGWIENVTGWAIGPCPDEVLPEEEIVTREINDLYSKLQYLIIPSYYQRRDDWIDMMENSIGKIAYYFNTHRMMRRYVTEAYF